MISQLITPDMVSFWVPQGQSRAMDLVRGNHGQCSGTHPNVPVIGKPAGANLVTNGGFDSDTTGWASGSSALLASVAGGRVGNCLRITENGAANPYAHQTIAVRAGKSYELSFYVKQGTEATFKYRIYDVTNAAWIYDSANAEAGAGWTQYPYTFETPAGCVSVRIYLYQMCLIAAGTTIYFDDVSIQEFKPAVLDPTLGWHFDGVDDYVGCGRDSSLDLTSVGTLSAWAKTGRTYPSDDATTVYKGIISKAKGGVEALLAYWIDWHGTNSTKVLRANLSNGEAYEGISVSNFNFGAGWRHIVYSWDGSYHRLYIDAVLQTPVAQTLNAQILLDADLEIGAAFETGSKTWDGHIALPFIANTAWSAEQVANFYNLTKGLFWPR